MKVVKPRMTSNWREKGEKKKRKKGKKGRKKEEKKKKKEEKKKKLALLQKKERYSPQHSQPRASLVCVWYWTAAVDHKANLESMSDRLCFPTDRRARSNAFGAQTDGLSSLSTGTVAGLMQPDGWNPENRELSGGRPLSSIEEGREEWWMAATAAAAAAAAAAPQTEGVPRRTPRN